MPLSSLICASIETSLNKLLMLDSSSQQRQLPLIGHTVGLSITELKQPLFFHFTPSNVEVLGQYEGDVSAQLTLDFDALLSLKNNGNISELIKLDKLVIDGDIKTLQCFADLLTKLDIDWQEHLSQYTGDVIAFKLGQGINKLKKSIRTTVEKTQSNASNYMIEEARLALGKLEFIHFSDQTDDVAMRTNKLAQQIDAMRNR